MNDIDPTGLMGNKQKKNKGGKDTAQCHQACEHLALKCHYGEKIETDCVDHPDKCLNPFYYPKCDSLDDPPKLDDRSEEFCKFIEKTCKDWCSPPAPRDPKTIRRKRRASNR